MLEGGGRLADFGALGRVVMAYRPTALGMALKYSGVRCGLLLAAIRNRTSLDKIVWSIDARRLKVATAFCIL